MTVVWIRGSARSRDIMRGAAFSSLNAIAFGEPIPRVRGNTAKIRFFRYNALNPNIGRVVTCGHSASSVASAPDHAFIWSDAATNGARFLDFVGSFERIS